MGTHVDPERATLDRFLRTWRRRGRLVAAARSAAELAGLVAGAWLVALAAFAALGYYGAVRDAVYLAALVAAAWILRRADRRALFAPYRPLAAARDLEAVDDRRGRLASATEFAFVRDAPGELELAHVRETARALGPTPWPARRALGRAAVVAGVALLLGAGVVAAFPAAAGRAWSVLAGRGTGGIAWRLVYPEKIAAGAAFRLVVETDAWRAEAAVRLDGETFRARLSPVAGGYALELPRVGRALAFSLVLEKPGASAVVPERAVTVLTEPYLAELVYSFTFPAHLGLAAKNEPASPFVEVPQGTRLGLAGKASARLAGAWLVVDGLRRPLAIDGERFTASLETARPIAFTLLLSNEQGLTNRDPVPYRVAVRTDAAPRVVLVSPAEDRVLERTLRQPLAWEADDDDGLARVALEYAIRHETWAEKGVVELAKEPGRQAWTWDLNDLPVSPGESVAFRVAAWDRAGQRGASVERVLRVPSLVDLLRKSDQETAKLKETLRELQDIQRETDKRIDKLEREHGTDPRSKFERKQELEQLKRLQEERQKKLDDFSKRLGEERKRLADEQSFSPETLAKLRDVQKALERLDLEMKPRIKQELEELLRREGPVETRNLRDAEREFTKRLDEMLEALKQLEQRRNLEGAQNLLRKMEEEARKLREELKNGQGNPEGTHRRLEELERELAKKLEALGKQATDPRDRADLDRAERERKGATADREQARQSTAKGNKEQSSRSLDTYQSRLEDMKKTLDGMQSRASGDEAERLRAALLRLVADGLVLAGDLERLSAEGDSLRRGDQGARRYFRDDPYGGGDYLFRKRLLALSSAVADARRAAGDRAKALAEATRGAPGAGAAAERELAQLDAALGRLLGHLQEGGAGPAAAVFAEASAAANRFVAALLSLLEALEQAQAQAKAGGKQGKPRPGEQGMQDLAEAQRRLDEKLSRLQGKAANGTLTARERAELQALARQQELIRRALEQMGQGENGRFLGDRAALQKEMRELEEKLRAGKLTREMYDKERQILKRLLQATRAMQREGFKDERQAEKPGEGEGGGAARTEGLDALERLERSWREFRRDRELAPADRELIQRYYRKLLGR